MPRKFVLSTSLLLLLWLPLLHAQTASTGPNPAATATQANHQAPDEMTKKITDLVLAGKYAEAQKLTEGLLIAYPSDQRLIKAKALIDSRLASGNSASAALVGSQPAQPAANANAAQLTGMDKVEYNGLIVLARQAQQSTDLDDQKKLMKRFMDQSAPFLRKHPEQLLIWQLRAASAVSLNEPMEGYEAGQKLLAAGAADSSDPALLQLLGQLNNNGWLDKQLAEKKADRLAQEAQEQEARETWTDTASGLTWTKKDNGIDVTWQQAMDYCRDLLLANHSDSPANDRCRESTMRKPAGIM